MNQKELEDWVIQTPVRIGKKLIAKLEAIEKERPLTEAQKHELARAKRLYERR